MRDFATSYDKNLIIKALKDNQARHKKFYAIALVGYRQEMLERAEALAELAQKEADADHLRGAQKALADLPYPKDRSSEYQDVIDMLEDCASEHIELTQDEYTRWVQDRWSWRGHFFASSQTYIEKGAAVLGASQMSQEG